MKEIDLSGQPMSGHQILMVVICFILNFSDGIDVLIVSFSSSRIIAEWGLSKVEMGYVFSSGLAGMTLGCFLIAPLADKIGRRKIFLISISMITIGMFGVGLSHDFLLMLGLRFLTGLGIGGILPTMTATAAEFSNQKYRDFNIGLVQAGWPVGAIVIGFVCARFIPIYGCHFAFIIAGCFSFATLLLVYFFMTDSLEFLLKNQSEGSLQKVNKLMQKMNMMALEVLPKMDQNIKETSVKSLFTPDFKDSTIKAWIAAFFGFLTLYTLMSWVPGIAKDAGLSFQLAALVGITLNIGAALGSASIGAIGSKFGLRQSQLTFMLCAFFVMLIYAFSTLTVVLIFILILLIGIFVQGGFNGIWPILSRIYPAEIRATGVGFTVGVGRFGAILGPLIFGYLVDFGLPIQVLFIIFSIPLLIMGISIWFIKSTRL